MVVIAWLLDLQLPVQSVTFTFYLVIKFVCDFRQVGGFLRVLQFLPPNTSDRHVITEILYKEALNYLTLKHQSWQYCLGPLFFLLPKIT